MTNTAEAIETVPHVALIPVAAFEWLQAEITRLNVKAAKLGSTPAILTVHGEITQIKENALTGFKFVEVFKQVSVTGEPPKLAGWKLLACVESQPTGENLFRCVPGETVPAEFRKTDTHCDHCKTARHRREVFILGFENGTTFCQVGRNCISDFLGGVSPDALLGRAAWLFSIAETLDADFDGEYYGPRGEPAYGLQEFVKMTAAVVRKCGWVSRGMARENPGLEATADVVGWLLTPGDRDGFKKAFTQKHGITLEPRDDQLALDAIAWGEALPADQTVDYIYNLGVAVRVGFVRRKTAGLVASLIAAYQRHLDREAELNIKRSAEAGKVRVHVGTVGKREGFAGLTIKAIRSFESDYGVRTMIRFENAEGSIFIWWSSSATNWTEGQTLDVTATVKKHDDYTGVAQTLLQRVAEGLPKVKGSKSKKVSAA